jgi:hypothetical protein
MHYDVASKPGKLPVVNAIREMLADKAIPMLFESKDELEQGNGSNLTTRQQSMIVNVTDDEGKPAGKVMLSWSANVWGPKVAGEEKRNGVEGDTRVTLTSKELASLDAAIAKFKEANDFDNAVKLATIKNRAVTDGKVSRDDFRIVAVLG